jgi:hypothetical protein
MRALIINCSHPLTPAQKTRIEELLTIPCDVVDRRVQFDDEAPLAPQVERLLDSLELSATDWQTRPIGIVPPALAPACAALLAALHGRTGHFPPVVRIAPRSEGAVTSYVVGEVLDLDGIRRQGRASTVGPSGHNQQA